MNSIHRSGFSTNYYNGFTPEKSLSTRLSHLNSTAENKQIMSTDNEIIKSSVLLDVQSMVSLGQQQIKKSQINELFDTMRLIKFLSQEAKSLSKMINLKKKNISALNQKREDQIKDIQLIKKRAQIQYEYMRQKSKEIRLRNKQKEIDISYKIKLMKQKIKRVKSLSREQRRSTYTESNLNSNIHEVRSKYRHKRMYTQMGYENSAKEAFNKAFIPIYIPYPVFTPYYPPPQSYQPNYRTRNSEYSLQKEYYSIKENSQNNSQRNSHIYINAEQRQQQKIKEFCTKLRDPLAAKQSKRYSRKQSRKSQNLQSLRNSCKTNSSKSQIKPKLNKGLFETDEEIHNQDDYEGQSFKNQKNTKSKMVFKITTSNSCEDQHQKYSNKPHRINKDRIKTQIIQEHQSSTVNVEIPSDKKQNSSWDKDTIERLNKKSIKNSTKQLKPKIKVNDRSVSQIEQLQQHAINSSLNGSDINIIITQSPNKSYGTLGLKNAFSSNEDQSVKNIENKNLINAKQSTKINKQLQKVGQMKQVRLKEQKNYQTLLQPKPKELVTSQIQINDISDDDMLFSTALVLESKITRNSHNKQAKAEEVKQQDDQILNSISLTPESRISRLSRQKQALRVSRSELKQVNTFQSVDQKTSISDIRQTKNLNTIQNPLSSSQENQLQLNQYETELRSTTPSRIVQKGKKSKRQSKKIDFMSGSIEQATEEEQSNLLSEIQFKNNRRKNKITT